MAFILGLADCARAVRDAALLEPEACAEAAEAAEAPKWKEVPKVPSLAPDEEEKDPFEVGRIFYAGFMLRCVRNCMKANIS